MPRPAAPVSLVVFDLGGVVVRICRSWAEACSAAGMQFRPIDDPELVEQRREAVRAYERGLIACEAFFERIAQATASRYTPEEVRLIHDAWLLGEYPGVGDLIEHLHRSGVHTGVLSNTNHAHWVRLVPRDPEPGHAFPSPGRTRHPHASHLLGLAKPDPAIYAEFARRTGHAPSEIVFFDDLAENVEAARRAGWRAERIDHEGETAAQMRAHLRAQGVDLA